MLIFWCNIAPGLLGRTKQRLQFAEGLNVCSPRLGKSNFATSRAIQHPNRKFQNSKMADLLRAAVRHGHATPYQRGLDPHLAAVPRMPRIKDFPEFPYMGVVLLACTTKIGLISGLARTHHPNGRSSRNRTARLWHRCRASAVYIIDTSGKRRPKATARLTQLRVDHYLCIPAV
jgi:hypothetical protein